MKLEANEPILAQICLSSSWGGQEMVAFEMAESFRAKGYKPYMFTSENSEIEKKCRANNITVFTFAKRKHLNIKLSKSLREFAKQHPSACFMSHQLSDLWMISPALMGLPNKLIGFSHTFVSYMKKNFLYKKLYSRLDHLIVLTPLQKKNILDHHSIEENKIVVIPNSVDTTTFNPSKKSSIFEDKYNAPKNALKICLVGRLDPQKGQEEVLIACKDLLKIRNDFQLYIIGTDTANSPGTMTKLKKYVEQNSMSEHVHFLGHCENVPELLASSDFKVMPSYGETFGRVVIEAMACGCPVLATNAGGVPDIITDNENGLLCEPRSAESLKEKILLLLESKELREKLRSNGLATVKNHYTREVVETQIEKLM